MKKNNIVIILLVILAVLSLEALFFNKDLFHSVSLLYYAKGILKSGFYVTAYITSLISIALILFIKNKSTFVFATLIILLSYFITTSYTLINAQGFGLTELQTLIYEANKFSFDVWNSYSKLLIKSFVAILLVAVVIYFVRKTIEKNDLYIPMSFIIFMLFVSFGLTLTVVYKTVNTNTKFPVPVNLIDTLIYYVGNAPYRGEREQLITKPSKPSAYENIIWIIDESIGGHYLSINGFEKNTTPYLDSIKDKFINLGQASSGANCSAVSNLILMSGIQLNQLPDTGFIALKKPNIFQYAQNAGYKTHYISGQSENDVLQNYMTIFDLKYIDNFYQPPTGFVNRRVPEGDLIEKTKEALKTNPKNFIYIVKRGAHFHWEGKYPKNKSIFTPHLEPSDNLEIKNKEKAINSYSNAIRYTVDDFFKSFYEQTGFANNDKTLIIYTSDHGQSIVEGNSNGTHCDGINPNISQGNVPLILFTNTNKNLFAKTKANHHNLYQLFPTTLELMGYENFEGKSLIGGPEDKQLFFSGDIFGRTSSQRSDITTQSR
jgi:glucan phosphoethanolaminetransferase (alkaline phosphatase superfamily)